MCWGWAGVKVNKKKSYDPFDIILATQFNSRDALCVNRVGFNGMNLAMEGRDVRKESEKGKEAKKT